VTADRLVVGSLVALFIAAMEFDACVETRAPSTAECVEDWNEPAGSMQRTQVISGGFRLADANGWVAKVIYPGCSVIFVTELDWPRLSCVRTFRAAVPRLTAWSCEGGQRWGRGRSIGTNFRPSVTVGSDGKLIGATPCHPTAASRAFLVSTRPLAKPTIRPLSSASLLERSTLSDPGISKSTAS